MMKDNLSRMAVAAAVFGLTMAGPGIAGAIAQSHDGHGTAATEQAGHAKPGHGSETAASESDWLKMTVTDSDAHAGHNEQADAGHGEHGAVASEGECDHVNHTGNCDHSQYTGSASAGGMEQTHNGHGATATEQVGHGEHTDAGHGGHGAVAEAATNASEHGTQPAMTEADWMKVSVEKQDKKGEHAGHAQN